MYYTDNIRDYAEINYKINKMYCKKYNLDLIISNEKFYQNRTPHWERLPLILKHIHNYDYVIWIDSDAFFYLQSINIKNIINQNLDKDFIFSQDGGNNYKNINSGFFIVKNSQYSIDFLNIWAFDEIKYKISLEKKRWNDQELLCMLYDENILDIKNKCIIYDYGILQHFNVYELNKFRPFIFHMAGMNSNDRIKNSTNYYKSLFPPPPPPPPPHPSKRAISALIHFRPHK
jgi:hypothetical protein